MSLLTLAHEWQFPEVFNLSMRKLDSAGSVDPVTKASLGKKLDIPEWFYSACASLVLRETPFSDDEAEILGYQLTLKLSRAREKVLEAKHSRSTQRGYLGNAVITILVEIFGQDVKVYLHEGIGVFMDAEKAPATYQFKAKAFYSCKYSTLNQRSFADP